MPFGTMPKSMADRETDSPARQRPLLVWFILGWETVGFVMAPISLLTMRSAVSAFPVAYYGLAIVNVALSVALVVDLFRLRATAVRYAVGLFAVTVASGIYETIFLDLSGFLFATKDLSIPPEVVAIAFRGLRISGAAVTWAFYGAVILYLRRLRRRRILC